MTKSRNADDSTKINDKKKKSILTNIFSKKGKNKRGCDGDHIVPPAEIVFDLESSYISKRSLLEAYPVVRKSYSGRHTSSRIEGLNLSILDRHKKKAASQFQEYRMFVGTWNVGGRCPNNGPNLEDFLQGSSCDIYVLGFQEIVPLNAGNVLVIEDNEPAAKWLALISQALSKTRDKYLEDCSACAINSDCANVKYGKADSKSSSSSGGGGGGLFFQKPSLKVLSKHYRVNSTLVKSCNCKPEPANVRRRARKLSDLVDSVGDDEGSDDECCRPMSHLASPEAARSDDASYSLITSKQMVGIFLSVWVRSELVQHIGHLRVASVGRGIMGCLGNKGCIAVSMSLHKTSFCFVCSHLTSGEKEGDELKRNADVADILKSTQFPRICKIPGSRMPEKILDHDRVVWLGDLNYRIALSYEDARTLLDDNNWGILLSKDQLRLEREAGRVFHGWKEGQIYFAPTYKYTQNSDTYAGDTTKSKKKRRTPAWCDRILWYGNGLEQLQYLRGESQFSDHRPVCAVFKAQAESGNKNERFCRTGLSSVSEKILLDDVVIPKRHSFYE
ncbi:type I inositol polyphosphate 5-phosphatase 5 [Canna indica]|uniref:Type I inositol polyphosphate 5-phosphatase 5 n=1 Tax=Canna indica TaxID=4628 RepID=A0AAQ3JNI1_9LILI|nr:type I inositol polyphosphate 5-phosphatase 5 [Canna indica]